MGREYYGEESMWHPIINSSKSKPVLLSAAQTKNREGLKICTCIVLTLTGTRKYFHRPESVVTYAIKEVQFSGFTLVR